MMDMASNAPAPAVGRQERRAEPEIAVSFSLENEGFVADSGWGHIETAIDHRKSLGIVKAAEIFLLEELPIAPGNEPCAYHQGEEKARDDIAVATERSREARFY